MVFISFGKAKTLGNGMKTSLCWDKGLLKNEISPLLLFCTYKSLSLLNKIIGMMVFIYFHLNLLFDSD
uniref:Uncharacterized protein n=1 Tax=Brassica oleracea var. oleracea TaxID=109376 RepID=A0A0D3DSL1_BRAOL